MFGLISSLAGKKLTNRKGSSVRQIASDCYDSLHDETGS